jgi:hypothetical protein
MSLLGALTTVQPLLKLEQVVIPKHSVWQLTLSIPTATLLSACHHAFMFFI